MIVVLCLLKLLSVMQQQYTLRMLRLKKYSNSCDCITRFSSTQFAPAKNRTNSQAMQENISLQFETFEYVIMLGLVHMCIYSETHIFSN